MGPEILVIMLFVLLLVSVFMGFPVAFGMMGSGLLVGLIGAGPDFFHTVVLRTYGVMEHYELVAIPLFVFMGVMLGKSGAAERMFMAFYTTLGGLRGGLALTTVVICTIMAAATGIVGASVISMGIIALPTMLEKKYDPGLACGAISAGGTLGILIPPSVMLVVYGPMAGISVGQLFVGAVLPGLVLSGLYLIYIAIRCYLKPELGPPMPLEERNKISRKQKVRDITFSLIPTLFVILAVMGSIFFGIAAPTEAAALGAAAAMLVALLYKQLTLKVIKDSLLENLKMTAMIMSTVIGAFIFTGAFMSPGGGEVVQRVLLGLPFGPYGLLFIMAFAFFILGFVMEWVGIVPILVPIFAPIIKQMGLDPLWVAIVFCVVMQTSFLTPPMAPALFYLKGVTPPSINFGKHIIMGTVPFLLLQIVGVIIVIAFPKLATWLPSIMIR
jgi:tripartite ATP-independent transporter DctM subunit